MTITREEWVNTDSITPEQDIEAHVHLFKNWVVANLELFRTAIVLDELEKNEFL
jgi:hypothetical protein